MCFKCTLLTLTRLSVRMNKMENKMKRKMKKENMTSLYNQELGPYGMIIFCMD